MLFIYGVRRVSLDLEPIGLPGRFMLGSFTDDEPFYIDVWSGGKFYDIDEMEDFLGELVSEDSGASLLPVTVAEILTRGCRNLVQQFAKVDNHSNSDLFQKFVNEFEDVHRESRREDPLLLEDVVFCQKEWLVLWSLVLPLSIRSALSYTLQH